MANFPFTILDVINALGLEIRKIHNDEIYFDCPHCFDGKKKHQGIAQAIMTDNVYNCPRCGTGGGMLQLYSACTGVDIKQANREMRRYVNAPAYSKRKKDIQRIVKQINENKSDTETIANRKVVDRTYRAFLSLCTLRLEHYNNLRARGLSDKNIAHYGFKSTPRKDEFDKIISALIGKGCTLKGVPGFYCENGVWNIAIEDYNQGYFVPYTNIEGLCCGMQIRLDVSKKMKYIWFSSSKKIGGCGRTSVPHFSNIFNLSESVYITEGGLKADVAHCLSHKTFVALAGVSQLSILPNLFKQLKNAGVKNIVDCFDSDCKYNEHVEKARGRLKAEVENAGLIYHRLEWDEKYKGIDDYLFAVPKGSREFVVYDFDKNSK